MPSHAGFPHEAFEDVLEVTDYYDGPRSGTANFKGVAHVFRSRFEDVYGPDDAVDTFELVPVSDTTAPPLLVRAQFEVAPDAPMGEPGQIRKLVVAWQEIDNPLPNTTPKRA